APIAQGWITGVNTGVAVADDPHNSQTAYQVVFGPAQSIAQLTAQITYVPGSTTLGTPGSETTVPVETVPPASISVPFVPTGASPSGASPATPSTTVPSANRSLGRSAIRNSGFASATPPGIFWVAVVLVLALLLSASVVLGDEPAEEPARGRRRLLVASARQGQPGSGPARPDKEE
ncbi:MAG TPA: hypothetical protein VKY26_02955, partial [Actinomycetota bacterium]|nr:hypothetical protein [Actinomycetota bacterium]